MNLMREVAAHLLGNTLYVRIHPDALTVRNVHSGLSVSGPPLIAHSRGERMIVMAAGEEATALEDRPDVRVVNPFGHPRGPLANFTIAEKLLQAFVQKTYGNRLIRPSPTMVMHLAVELEGGITQIEIRVLRELAAGAGARQSIIWMGPDLTDEQIRERTFPAEGRVLDEGYAL